MRIGYCKYEVCGQVNVINLFRDEDKRAKKFFAICADCKGNFARERSRAARAKYRADRAIARIGIWEPSRAIANFRARRKSRASVERALEFFSRDRKIFFDRSGNHQGIAMTSRKKSDELFNRASVKIPGAVNSPVRAWKAVGAAPIFIESGSGATLIDADGNAFLDYVCSYGPAILGHAHHE